MGQEGPSTVCVCECEGGVRDGALRVGWVRMPAHFDFACGVNVPQRDRGHLSEGVGRHRVDQPGDPADICRRHLDTPTPS